MRGVSITRIVSAGIRIYNWQSHRSISFVLNGQSISFASAITRDLGWLKINNDTVDLSAEQLKETKETTCSGWITSLRPLKDKAFQLAPFGEIEIAGRKATGVNVTHEGHHPVNLFFDKEMFRLVRSETRVRDEATAQEMTEESTYSEFKTVEGTQQAMKVSIKRDGKPHGEVEVEEFKLSEKLDDRVFAKP